MVSVRPFRATYFNPDEYTELERVISPPYDVISDAGQESLYQQDPHNFVRIDYGKILPGDDAQENRYTRAKNTLQAWLDSGVLSTEEKPAFYLHNQTFTDKGKSFTRSDLFVMCQVGDYGPGQVLRHEKTLAGPKADRLALMTETQAHLSPVYCVYEDPQQALLALFARIAETDAIFSFDENDLHHDLYKITDPQDIQQIQDHFESRSLYIADGHHRYETARTFSQAHPDQEAAQYICMYLSALEDPGLVVWPYHRMVRPSFKWPEWSVFLERAAQYFTITAIERSQIQASLDQVPADGSQMHLVIETPAGAWLFTRAAVLPDDIAAERSATYRHLDVSVLHELILYQLVDFPTDKAKDPDYIRFSPEVSVLQSYLESEGGVAFYLNATPLQALCQVADENETMPPKSTYFYPKVPSGLIFACFDSLF